MNINNRFEKVLSAVLVAALLICETAFADTVRPSSSSVSNAEIEAMLSGGEYAAGEVLLLLRKEDSEETGFLGSSGDDILSSGEVLMEVPMGAALTGIGEPVPEETEEGLFLGSSCEPDVQIVHIKSDTLSTRELMYKLYGNSRVMAVQPNYIHRMEAAEMAEVTETADINEVAEVTGTVEVVEVPEEGGALKEEASAGAMLFEPGPGTNPYPDLTEYQWAYNNGGEFNAMNRYTAERLSDFDMGIEHWNDSTVENATGYVVIVDTGIDYNNPDLANVMAHLTSKQSAGTNGGEFGYNATDDSDDPIDIQGHGTHCAGIIAAEWNDFGTSGICNGAQLIGVAVAERSGIIQDHTILRGYSYIATIMDNGVDVVAINNSFGLEGTAEAVLAAAVTLLGEKGAVTVFSSGNSGLNLDICPTTAWGLYGNPYTITVGSSSIDGKRSFFSNYGQGSCDVYAPGSEIMSTVPDYLGYYLGTADPDPVYQNRFTEGMGSHFYVGQSSLDDMAKFSDGNLKKGDLPADEDDISGSTYVSPNSFISFDTDGGSLMLSKSSDSETAGGCVNLFIPVKKSQLDSINRFSACFYSDGNHYSYTNAVFYWENTADPSDDSLYTRLVKGSINSYTFVDTSWTNVSTATSSQKPLTVEGKEFNLYTIPSSDPDTVLLPVALMFRAESGQKALDVFIDSVSLGSVDTCWNIMEGTSMAAPAVSGAAAVAAKIQQNNGMSLTGSVSAMWRANYIKAHILKMDDESTSCRQGGMVNLNVNEYSLTPVINEIMVEEGTSVLTITGAYFGQETGQVTISGKECQVTSWSNTEITAVAPADAASGEPCVRVTGKNEMTGAAKVRFQSPQGLPSFADVLPSPAANDGDTFTTCSLKIPFGLISGSIAATDDSVLAILVDPTDTSLKSLMCYDRKNRTWSSLSGVEMKHSLYSGMAEKDGIIYISVTSLNYSYFSFISHLYAYDTSTRQVSTIDTSELGSAFSAAGIVNADGTLMLAGGLDSEGHATTENNIAVLTVTDGKAHVEVVGDLFFINENGGKEGSVCPRLAYFDKSLYAAGGSWYGTGSLGPNTAMTKAAPDADGKWTCESITGMLPEGLLTDIAYYQPTFGLTSTDEGVFLVGVTVMKDGEKTANDTYILRSDSSAFEPWDRVFCLGQTVYTLAASHDGVIFGIAVSRNSAGEDGNLYFAASEKDEMSPTAMPEPDSDDQEETSPSAIQKSVPLEDAESISVSWTLGNDEKWGASCGGVSIENTFANISYNGETYWYHFNEMGEMDTGWTLVNNDWYYMSESHDGFYGRMLTKCFNDSSDGFTYYLGSNGKMLTGWQFIDGSWYYFNNENVTSYSYVDGRWTYTNRAVRPYGAMFRNELTPDGYMVDENGKWIG